MEVIKKVGVLTSGGDAPGMNAAIRAVTRAAIHNNLEVYGIRRGYQGMIEGDIFQLKSNDVSGILQNGGTILQTARCKEFLLAEGRHEAYEQLIKFQIDGVVVIGGDGSFTGASIMTKEYDIPFIGIPGTIDNDLFGTDYTIGYDTALNTVASAVDKIRDTASSHSRIFFVEVMGKEAGFLALTSGIALGAEGILIPEVKSQFETLKNYLCQRAKLRKSSIVLVAEGDDEGRAIELASKFQKEFPELDIRTTILGHIQRGGSPSVIDRVNASRMGVAAIEALLVPLNKTFKVHKEVSKELLEMAALLN